MRFSFFERPASFNDFPIMSQPLFISATLKSLNTESFLTIFTIKMFFHEKIICTTDFTNCGRFLDNDLQ